jgi:hypothetical protein
MLGHSGSNNVVKKYVLSIEEIGKTKGPQFVYASSNMDDVKYHITMKYRGAREMLPTSNELFKLHVVKKYYYTLQRTREIQSKFILRITTVNLKGDNYNEKKEDAQ